MTIIDTDINVAMAQSVDHMFCILQGDLVALYQVLAICSVAARLLQRDYSLARSIVAHAAYHLMYVRNQKHGYKTEGISLDCLQFAENKIGRTSPQSRIAALIFSGSDCLR